MNKILSVIWLMFIAITLTSCPNPAVVCNTSNTPFQAFYASLSFDAVNYIDRTAAYDLPVHEYTFSVNTNQSICAVGYQSHPLYAGSNYLIEIISDVNGTVVYTGSHSFSSGAVSYVSIAPVALAANQKYIFRRTASGYPNITVTAGHVLQKTVASGSLSFTNFPLSAGGITIYNTKMKDPSINRIDVNKAIPYLDFTLQ